MIIITPAPDSIIIQQTTYSAEACNILNPDMPNNFQSISIFIQVAIDATP